MLDAMNPAVRDLRKHLVRVEVIVEVVEVMCDEAQLDGDVQLDLVHDAAQATCSACLAALDQPVGTVLPLRRRASARLRGLPAGNTRARSA